MSPFKVLVTPQCITHKYCHPTPTLTQKLISIIIKKIYKYTLIPYLIPFCCRLYRPDIVPLFVLRLIPVSHCMPKRQCDPQINICKKLRHGFRSGTNMPNLSALFDLPAFLLLLTTWVAGVFSCANCHLFAVCFVTLELDELVICSQNALSCCFKCFNFLKCSHRN